jgi:rubrerythrin
MKIVEKKGKFSIVDFDAVEAYQIACKIEKDGIDFYKKMAKEAAKPEVRETIEFLIKEEQAHLKIFEDRLYELREKSDSDKDYDSDDLLTSMDFGVFKSKKKLEVSNEKTVTIKEALQTAVKAEEKSVRFYNLCLKYLTSAKVKQEIEKIIGQEKQHKQIFQIIVHSI